MAILVTGFEPFGGADINPSADLARALSGTVDVAAEILPTSFFGSGPRLLSLMDQYRPSLILMFGVHEEAVRPRLERVALNFDHAEIADNDGDQRQSCPIRDGAALALETSVNVAATREALAARGHTVDISHHAGTYVCNHAYYMALDYLARSKSKTPCLFIHIPAFKDKPGEEIASLTRLTADLVSLLGARA